MRAFRNGSLLTHEYTEMILKPHCKFSREYERGTWRTGYGFEFLELGGKIFCMYKEGGNPGVEAMCSYYPKLDVGLDMLSNQTPSQFARLHEELQTVLFETSKDNC